MEKVKIIINPKSGKEQGLNKLNHLINLLSNDGINADIRFTKKSKDAIEFAKIDEGEDLIISFGGDGTLNEVASGIFQSKRETPLAIFPSGTVNDFATSLKIPNNVERFYDMIKKGKTKKIDLGQAGDKIFVNVAAGGLLTEIAYQVPEETKTFFGRMAYYIEGVKEVSKIRIFKKSKSIPVKIQTKEETIEENITMFIIANSNSVGGFKNIAPNAKVDDGYFDIVIIKEIYGADLPLLLASIVSGSHINHDKVIYLKSDEISIETKNKISIDLDGEEGGKLPMKFKNLKKAINLIV